MPDDEENHGAFYLNIIHGLVGESLGKGGNRWENRDRQPERLGGDDTPKRCDQKLMARYALARDVLSRLHDLRPPSYPDRPAVLPLTNVTLVGHLAAARRKGKTSVADREVAGAFGRWRYEVSKLESMSRGRLGMCLDTYDVLAAVDARGDDDLGPQMQHLEMFVRKHWGMRPPYPADDGDRERETRRACRQTELLPTWLLNGERPPGRFVPQGGFDPRGSQGQTEDDDDGDDGDVPF